LNITVGDAALAGQALTAGLVDECHVFLKLVVLGRSKRALPDNVRPRLELLDERSVKSGVRSHRRPLRRLTRRGDAGAFHCGVAWVTRP
jgi:dihydrofolate reductase